MSNPTARRWLLLANISLLMSGALALIVTGAKAPALKSLIPDLDLIRWCLVIHVNLATLVWFTSTSTSLILMDRPPNRWSEFGFWLATGGVGMMMSVLPGSELGIILSNYIPVLDHPRFLSGLSLYLLGLGMSLIKWPTKITQVPTQSELPLGYPAIRFGLLVGLLFIYAAIASFSHAYWQLAMGSTLPRAAWFEIGMWGGGHLLQHSSSIFMLCSWVLLLSGAAGKECFSRKDLFCLFAYLSVPLLLLPLVFNFAVTSNEYRESFTHMMRWGIFPAIFVWTAHLLRNREFWLNFKSDFRFQTVIFSLLLVGLSFVFGALIRGPDMRVPGHYHAGIGAVTLTFMGLSYALFSARSSASIWIRRCIWTYGLGQTAFASGMFIAGTFGMARKTYGSQHVLENFGQQFGFGLMAVGGLVAFAGGLFFAIAITPQLQPIELPQFKQR